MDLQYVDSLQVTRIVNVTFLRKLTLCTSDWYAAATNRGDVRETIACARSSQREPEEKQDGHLLTHALERKTAQ